MPMKMTLSCTARIFRNSIRLIDWLLEKKAQGYKMVNSASRIAEMKQFVRGKLQEWNCRAGQNTLIIRTDGSLAPCFPMYTANHD